jgi:hypothetical protein
MTEKLFELEYEFYSRILHLFLSRRFLVLCVLIYMRLYDYLNQDLFFWGLMAVLGSNTLEKFKDISMRKE